MRDGKWPQEVALGFADGFSVEFKEQKVWLTLEALAAEGMGAFFPFRPRTPLWAHVTEG